jgi:hypothetical protein
MNSLYALPGVLVAGLGFCLMFGLLASVGALSKSKQLSAFGALLSGRAGTARQLLFFLGIATMALGSCGAFAGVAISDAGRARACEQFCRSRGYARGSLGPSRASDPKYPGRAAFVACTCAGGPAPDPLETRAADLRF